jgi:ribosomal protein L32
MARTSTSQKRGRRAEFIQSEYDIKDKIFEGDDMTESQKTKGFICSMCGMTFASKEELEKHTREAHGKE